MIAIEEALASLQGPPVEGQGLVGPTELVEAQRLVRKRSRHLLVVGRVQTLAHAQALLVQCERVPRASGLVEEACEVADTPRDLRIIAVDQSPEHLESQLLQLDSLLGLAESPVSRRDGVEIERDVEVILLTVDLAESVECRGAGAERLVMAPQALEAAPPPRQIPRRLDLETGCLVLLLGLLEQGQGLLVIALLEGGRPCGMELESTLGGCLVLRPHGRCDAPGQNQDQDQYQQ